MNFSISFPYPTWFLFLCPLVGLIYTYILYKKDLSFNNTLFPKNYTRILLATFRFLLVSAICFLLLAPVLKNKSTNLEKPIIIFAQDNSESIHYSIKKEDSIKYINDINNLMKNLKRKYDVRTYSFGEKVKENGLIDFSDKATNVSEMLSNVYDLFQNQNIGAIILATDGLYNQGNNPLYHSNASLIPLYTLALGDTTPKRDLVIQKVRHNKIVYLGDQYICEAEIYAQNCSKEKTIIEVYEVGSEKSLSKISSQNINVNEDNFYKKVSFTLEAKKPGVVHYRFIAKKVDGEFTATNNSKDIFVEVLDSRQKILLLANAPHPDLAALRQAIENNKNYEVEIQFIDKFNAKVEQYGLVILHQLPTQINNVPNILEKLRNQHIPIFFILGQQTNMNVLNTSQQLVQIKFRNNYSDAQAFLESGFSLFTLSEQTTAFIRELPPLQVPFGEYNVSPTSKIILNQKIGSVETKYPLMLTSSVTNKELILCGEGIWRWQLYDYMLHQNKDAFNEIILKPIQYLLSKEDTRRFRIIMNNNNIYENEIVHFDGELYNVSYELINEPKVNLTVVSENKDKFPFVLEKETNKYSLDAGYFPVGIYNYTAETSLNGENLNYSGKFTINKLQLEDMQTTANHSWMYQLSEKTNGKMFYPDNIDKLGKVLIENDYRPIVYQSFSNKELLHEKWIFFLLIILLGGEWFVRKWAGSY